MTGTGLVHCKDTKHLHVVVAIDVTATRVTPTATFMAEMPCKNKSGPQPGIVISIVTGQPLNGLHVYSSAATWLADELRISASECTTGETVSIQHPENGVFHTFVTLTPAAAVLLATAIDAAH